MEMNTANKLTLLRIVMIPFFIFFVYNYGNVGMMISAFIFTAAAITDFLDGYIARKYNQVSDFGIIFDPIADKVLVLAALIPLAQFGLIPGVFVIILLAREFIVGGFRNFVASKGGKVIAASILGKLKTITQISMIIGLLLQDNILSFIPDFLYTVLIYAAVVLSIWSMIDYIRGGREALKNLD